MVCRIEPTPAEPYFNSPGLARAASDGNTLLITGNTYLLDAQTRKANYHPVTGFEPICYLAMSPAVLVVNSASPYRTLAELLEAARAYLGPDFDIAKHFTPRYRPWQQRLAFIPDGDLFRGIAAGKASVVTDEIDRFTATGIRLKSGEELPADVIITATGFELSPRGDIDFVVDGRPVATYSDHKPATGSYEVVSHQDSPLP